MLCLTSRLTICGNSHFTPSQVEDALKSGAIAPFCVETVSHRPRVEARRGLPVTGCGNIIISGGLFTKKFAQDASRHPRGCLTSAARSRTALAPLRETKYALQTYLSNQRRCDGYRSGSPGDRWRSRTYPR